MLFTYSKSYTAIGKEVRKLINEVYFCFYLLLPPISLIIEKK